MANARAIADTLNRYEFLKIRTGQLRSDLQASQVEKLGLKVQLIRVTVGADSCARQSAVLSGQVTAARAEVRVWRGVALLVALKTVGDIIGFFK